METSMSFDSERGPGSLERLSALVDGELDRDMAAQACVDWRESDGARATWHAYHVIGDVLRSDDLARDAARDPAFLAALRVRLQEQPVVLAPQPLVPAPVAPESSLVANGGRRVRWRWMAPSAVAAGFVAVAGAVLLTRAPSEADDASARRQLASATPAIQPVTATASTNPMAPAAEPQALAASGQLIRDARLDRYLAAHKQFAGSSALGVPSGFLRNATAIETGR
jgi:sigma-E factor negative regulatory protein RseA